MSIVETRTRNGYCFSVASGGVLLTHVNWHTIMDDFGDLWLVQTTFGDLAAYVD